MVRKVLTLMIGYILMLHVYQLEASDITSAEVNAKYKVERVITERAKNANHDVYKATTTDAEQNEVIIKKIANKRLIGRDEEKIHKQLTSENHQNVINLVEVIKEDDFTYFVTEYSPGGDLLNHITKNKALDETIAKNFIIQIAHTVQYMHEREIVHRDLKPENIILMFPKPNEIPVLKLIDFGHACYTNEPGKGKTWGTANYKAPSYGSGDLKKGDVYSMGIILYVILTEKTPNEAFRYKSVKTLDSFVSKGIISPEMEILILKMTDKDPETRISVTEVISELEEDVLKVKKYIKSDF